MGKKVDNFKLNFPFVDGITHIHVGKEAAETFGLPEAGEWHRVKGDTWELRRSFESHYEYDDTKCAECQGWGAPSGCGTCKMFSMGG